jgi:hypothetical protein
LKDKEKKFYFGVLLIVVGIAITLMPVAASMEMLSVGFGVSHRDEEITVAMGGTSSFEVARIYNTGDQPYTVVASWQTTGGSLADEAVVTVHPSERLLQPDESYLLLAEIEAPMNQGTISGVVEAVSQPSDTPIEGDVGGAVLPSAELPFTITVSDVTIKPEPSWSFNVFQVVGCLCAVVGSVVCIAEYRRK